MLVAAVAVAVAANSLRPNLTVCLLAVADFAAFVASFVAVSVAAEAGSLQLSSFYASWLRSLSLVADCCDFAADCSTADCAAAAAAVDAAA